MWIDVEGFEMVSIDDTTDGFICIGSAVTFGGCLSKIVLEFCVWEASRVGAKLVDVVLDFLPVLLVLYSLGFLIFFEPRLFLISWSRSPIRILPRILSPLINSLIILLGNRNLLPPRHTSIIKRHPTVTLPLRRPLLSPSISFLRARLLPLPTPSLRLIVVPNVNVLVLDRGLIGAPGEGPPNSARVVPEVVEVFALAYAVIGDFWATRLWYLGHR